MVKVGDVVVHVDGNGDEQNAVVTSVIAGDKDKPKLNLAFVSIDDHAQDEYGRQLERKTGIPHKEHAEPGTAHWKETKAEKGSKK